MVQSALNAGYSPAMANIAGAQIEPKHNQSIKEALQTAGVTTNRLAEVIQDGLTASKGDGSTDYKERREYTKLSLEAMGELKSGSSVAVQINFPSGLADRWALDTEE